MSKIIISADSTCDLSPELTEKYDIKILSLPIIMNEQCYKDGVDIQPKDVFEHFEKTGELVKSSAGTVVDYLEWFKQWNEQGYEVIHFSISSDMSGTYNNCRLAAQEVGNGYAVDSRNLSSGIGQLAIEAAIARDKGLTSKEIYDYVNEMKEKLDVSFIIDTLKYLHKGGRCSSVAALGANLLKLKPCIEVKSGVMGVGKKYRGKLEDCFYEYVEDKLKDVDDVNLSRIFITHTCEDDEMVERVKRKVASLHNFEDIWATRAGCTISVHCGPNTLGVLFFHK